MPPEGGWQRVAGLLIVGTVATVTAVLTGSAETAVTVVSPLLPFLGR
jgi:hypothetical protein